MILYRAVSKAELSDYNQTQQLRTGHNTIEGKQFFKSREAVNEFISDSIKQKYNPPYHSIFEIHIDLACLSNIDYDEQELDTFKAITIREANLPSFNKCINFIDVYDI